MNQPFFSSRKWIKVWINEWRDGTLRWQATESQRAFWVDLLALAGRSRYPGIVCAGKDADRVVGYPAGFLAPNSTINAENIDETLNLFKTQGMVTYTTSKSAQGHTLYAITITNWKKYQSDYEANKGYQKKYREKKKASSPSSERLTSQLVARKTLEVDLEVDKEKEEEKEQTPARAPYRLTEVEQHARVQFEKFWESYPNKLDRDEAYREFLSLSPIDQLKAAESVPIWAKDESWQERRFIPAPANFIRKRRWESTPKPKPKKESLADELARLEKQYGVS